jgi:PAS domain S-box-containing protein
MSKTKPTYQQLEKRLALVEPIIEALKHHEVDAIVGEGKIAFLLLRKVEEALLESNEEFRAMFELSGVGMVQADTPAFRFTRVNPKFCEIAGYSAEELLSKSYIDLTHAGDRRRDMQGLARVIRGKADAWSIEKRCVRKDGSVIWVAVNGAGLRDQAGRAVKFMAMIEDVTARKQAEQQQRDAQEELKKRVQERTAALSQTVQSLRSQVAKRKLAEQVLRDRSKQLRRLASELTVAEHRERRRIAQILHDHLQELFVGGKRPRAPLERVKEDTVRQALKEVQDLIERFIGLTGDKASAEQAKPMPRKKAPVKKARKSGGRRSRPPER